MTGRSTWIRMLDECLQWADEHDDIADEKFNVKVFERMRRDLERPRFELSIKQIGWVEGVYEKLFDIPVYQNAVSAGQVPRGKEVPTPAVLQYLPKLPPHRMRSGA